MAVSPVSDAIRPIALHLGEDMTKLLSPESFARHSTAQREFCKRLYRGSSSRPPVRDRNKRRASLVMPARVLRT